MARLANGQSPVVWGGTGGTIYWNPDGTPLPTTAGDDLLSPTTDLAHEMFHGFEADLGMEDTDPHAVPNSDLERNEYRASYFENQIRNELNLPLRTGYHHQEGGEPMHTVNLLDKHGNPINVPPSPAPPALQMMLIGVNGNAN